MKILKNIKLLCALLCIAALYSCDKYLDIQPVGKVIPRTAAEFRALLTQAYSYVPSDRGLATFRSDEMIMDGTLAELNDFFHCKHSTSCINRCSKITFKLPKTSKSTISNEF